MTDTINDACYIIDDGSGLVKIAQNYAIKCHTETNHQYNWKPLIMDVSTFTWFPMINVWYMLYQLVGHMMW